MPYDASKPKILAWKNGIILHWVLNPEWAINSNDYVRI